MASLDWNYAIEEYNREVENEAVSIMDDQGLNPEESYAKAKAKVDKKRRSKASENRKAC